MAKANLEIYPTKLNELSRTLIETHKTILDQWWKTDTALMTTAQRDHLGAQIAKIEDMLERARHTLDNPWSHMRISRGGKRYKTPGAN
jgi:hypothetical protein